MDADHSTSSNSPRGTSLPVFQAEVRCMGSPTQDSSYFQYAPLLGPNSLRWIIYFINRVFFLNKQLPSSTQDIPEPFGGVPALPAWALISHSV